MTEPDDTSALEAPSSSDRQGFNRRWYATRPDLVIFRPKTAHEAVVSFQSVIDASPPVPGNSVQVTCGRHCYEDFVYNADTRFTFDVSGLRAFEVTGPNQFWVDVGFGNWDMFRTMNNMAQRTLPAGSCYSVGLGGHITGGGYGLLSRLFGLTIDYLSAVDIVLDTPQGAELVHCTETNDHKDLLWGIKGGGGQFGLITRYYFDKVPPAPDQMYTFSITWDWKPDKVVALQQEHFNCIVRLFETDFCVQSAYWHEWAMLHLNHMDAGNITIGSFVYYIAAEHGDQAAFEADLGKRLKAFRTRAAQIAPLSEQDYILHGHPYVHSVRGMNAGINITDPRNYTFLEGTQNFNGSGPNRFGKYKSAYMRRTWTLTMLEMAFKYLTTPVFDDLGHPMDMSQSLIQVDSYGGQINQVASDATAIPQRDSIMKLQYQTYWDNNAQVGSDDPRMEVAHCRWINEMYTAIYAETGGYPDPKQDPSDNVDGCYYNYPDLELGYDGSPNKPLSFALSLYFGDNLARMTACKRTYNPKGWFGNKQSIDVS